MPLLRIRLLNRQMGHHFGPMVLKGHSGKVYGTSRFSPADNCHCVEMTHEAYEAARQDLSKAMRLGSRKVWEVAVEAKDEGGRMKDEEDGLQKRSAELEALLEERRVAMAEQGDVNLQLRAELARFDRVLDVIDTAWGIIANAGGGKWSNETPQWQEAAQRWHDTQLYPLLAVHLPDKKGASIHISEAGDVATISLHAPAPAPVPQGTGHEEPGTNNQEPLSPLPEVSERTPWNALQKIAKTEGVDLKLHKNKASLLKAIEDRRAAQAAPALSLPAVTPVATASPPGHRVLRLWDEQDGKTLDIVFFAEVVDDPELWASSDGTKGKTTLKSAPMPCRDKQEREKARDAFYATLNAAPAAA